MPSKKTIYAVSIIVVNVIFILTGFAFASGSIALERKVLQAHVRASIQDATNDTTRGVDFSVLDNFASRLGVILIVIASFFLSISIFGILGTYYSNVACLNVCDVLLIISVVSFTIVPLVLYTHYVHTIFGRETLHNIAKRYDGDDSKYVTVVVFNTYMKASSCCGWNNYKDFESAERWERTATIKGKQRRMNVPEACCKLDGPLPNGRPINKETCVLIPNEANSNGNTGCSASVRNHIDDKRLWISIVCVFIIAMQLGTLWLITKFKPLIIPAQEATPWGEAREEEEVSEETPEEENNRFEKKKSAGTGNSNDLIPWLQSFIDVSIFATIWNTIFGCTSKKKKRRKSKRKHHVDSTAGELIRDHSRI